MWSSACPAVHATRSQEAQRAVRVKDGGIHQAVSLRRPRVKPEPPAAASEVSFNTGGLCSSLDAPLGLGAAYGMQVATEAEVIWVGVTVPATLHGAHYFVRQHHLCSRTTARGGPVRWRARPHDTRWWSCCWRPGSHSSPAGPAAPSTEAAPWQCRPSAHKGASQLLRAESSARTIHSDQAAPVLLPRTQTPLAPPPEGQT